MDVSFLDGSEIVLMWRALQYAPSGNCIYDLPQSGLFLSMKMIDVFL